MSTTFEQWQKAKDRQYLLAYQIASAVAMDMEPRPNDIARFKENEAEMRRLETQFSEES